MKNKMTNQPGSTMGEISYHLKVGKTNLNIIQKTETTKENFTTEKFKAFA